MVWPEMASTRSGLKWLDAISVPIKSPARAGGAGNGDRRFVQRTINPQSVDWGLIARSLRERYFRAGKARPKIGEFGANSPWIAFDANFFTPEGAKFCETAGSVFYRHMRKISSVSALPRGSMAGSVLAPLSVHLPLMTAMSSSQRPSSRSVFGIPSSAK